MENASKALIMAASVLITIMIFSFMVYMFRRMGNTARATEQQKLGHIEIDAFNSKFVGYDTGNKDSVTITHVRRTGTTNSTESIDYSYSRILGSSGAPVPDKDYYKALVGISQDLNNVVDLVTAINDAIDVNYNNNNGYMYGSNLEVQNSVEIIVDLGPSNNFEFSKNGSNYYRYLVIEPNKNIKPKYIYGFNGLNTSASNNTQRKNTFANTLTFGTSNAVSVYDMLKELRDTKVIPSQDKMAAADLDRQYTVYKYYFNCEVIINEFTELVETLKFTLVKDNKF